MKGTLFLLFSFLLLAISSCQTDTEESMSTKISSIDNAISAAQPYQTTTNKQIYFTSSSHRIPVDYPLENNLETETLKASEENDFAGLSDETALSALFSKLAEPTQCFYIDTKKDTTLIGARGTLIEIKANSLLYRNGKPATGIVKFEVNEYIDKSQFVYAGLSTHTSKGDFLESGGMLNLTSYSGNENLILAKGKSIQFQIPTDEVKQDMELFSGIRDVHGNMKWKQAGNKGKNKSIRNSSSKKTNPSKILKEKIMIEENILVKYCTGEEIYKKNYSHPDRNTLYNKEKLDSITIYMEIDEKNIVKNTWSKRSSTKAKKKPPIYTIHNNPLKTSHWNYSVRENEKINLNKSYEVGTGIYASKYNEFYHTDFFIIHKNWLKTKKEKKNQNKVMSLSMQRIYVNSDTLKENPIEKENKNLQAIEANLSVDRPTKVRTTELEYYIFTTAQLGWINVDRFYHTKGPKTQFSLENKNPNTGKISLVFKNLNAVLPGHVENGRINFGTVPIGEEVTIVGIKMINGSPMLAMQETITTKEATFQPLEFKPVNLAELKLQMRKINDE